MTNTARQDDFDALYARYRELGEGVKAEIVNGEAQDDWSHGDLDKGFEDAELVIDESFYTAALTHHPLEPRSCMAYWQNGKCYLHASSQSIAIAHFATARQLGIEVQDLPHDAINKYYTARA